MEKYLAVLQKCPLFEEIAPGEIFSMLKCLGAQVKLFDKKDFLLSEGDAAGHIGLVLEGAVRIEQTDYFGNRSILGRAGPGELFGESFACAGIDTLPLDVTAAESGAAMFLDCGRILRTCTSACTFHQKLVYNLMKIMAQKNLAFHRRFGIAARRTTREKLLAYLAAQAKDTGCASFTIPFDRQQLADHLLVDRSGLCAEISRLRAEGLLECRKNRFTLLRPPEED